MISQQPDRRARAVSQPDTPLPGCRHCGNGYRPPRWGREYLCPRCGEPLTPKQAPRRLVLSRATLYYTALVLALMGAILLPLGLWAFLRIEAWAKRTGKLKRTG